MKYNWPGFNCKTSIDECDWDWTETISKLGNQSRAIDYDTIHLTEILTSYGNYNYKSDGKLESNLSSKPSNNYDRFTLREILKMGK